MLSMRDNECREIDELAQCFWPAFKALSKKQKLCVFVLASWYGYIGWRDRKTNNVFLWIAKSFLKGFCLKFIACLLLGLIVSEIPFLVELANGEWNVTSTRLIDPLRSALPALLGMVLLDYLLDPDLSRSVLFPAIVMMLAIAFFGYHFCYVTKNLTGIYIVTGCVMLMSWCIKVRDQRMMDSVEDALKLIPQGEDVTKGTSSSVQNVVRRGKKTITLNRNEA